MSVRKIFSIIFLIAGLSAAAGYFFDFYQNKKLASAVGFSVQRPQIKIPSRVCDIEKYGALGDGQTKNTEFIARAIEDCAGKGGGRVMVPEGRWLTGKIHLKSNIELHLDEGAEIVFSADPDDYLPAVFTRFEGMELYNYSPLIYARDAENVAITGKGKLNGQGEKWAGWNDRQFEAVERLYVMAENSVPVQERIFGTKEDALRPSFIQFINSKNIKIEGVSILDGPMWTVHLVYSENILIDKIKINTFSHNTDGIVVDSSRNIRIENSEFQTGDDAISIKSGLDREGMRINKSSENIIVRNCLVKKGHSGLAIGSEMSGGIKNILVYDYKIENVDRGIRFKSLPGRGGVVENFWADDISMSDIDTAIDMDMTYPAYTILPLATDLPIFRNFNFSNLAGSSVKNVAKMKGIEGNPIKNVAFKNIDFDARGGIMAEDIENFVFDRINIKPEKVKKKRRPLFSLKNVQDIVIKNSTCAEDFQKCLEIDNADPAEITLDNNTPEEKWKK